MPSSAVQRPGLSEPQRFGLRFFALLVLASILAWLVSLPDRLGFAQRFLAGSGTWLADLVGGSGRVNGDQITVSTLSLDINYECTGVYVVLILCVFLFAYPASWRSSRSISARLSTLRCSLSCAAADVRSRSSAALAFSRAGPFATRDTERP